MALHAELYKILGGSKHCQACSNAVKEKLPLIFVTNKYHIQNNLITVLFLSVHTCNTIPVAQLLMHPLVPQRLHLMKY